MLQDVLICLEAGNLLLLIQNKNEKKTVILGDFNAPVESKYLNKIKPILIMLLMKKEMVL